MGWKKIMTLTGKPGYEPEQRSPPDDMKYKTIHIPLTTIRAAFKELVKYDMFVLVYFLCAVAVAVLSFMAPNSITHAADCPHAVEVRSWGMSFLWLDVLYVPLWYFCCP